MNFTISWSSLYLLFGLSIYVYSKTICIDRSHLGTPVWVLSKAGDYVPNNIYSELSNNFDQIRPFINWDGVVKMVPPSLFDRNINPNEIHPEVYIWDSLPSFKNDIDGLLPNCRCCEGGENLDEWSIKHYFNKILQNSITYSPSIMASLAIIIIIAIILISISSCSTCRHRPDCKNLENESISSYSNSDEDIV